jgi:hypothetical protein
LLMHFIEKVIEVAVVFGELSVIVNVAWCSSMHRFIHLIPHLLLLLLGLLNLKQKVLVGLNILKINGIILRDLRIWDFSSLLIWTHEFLASRGDRRGAEFGVGIYLRWFC